MLDVYIPHELMQKAWATHFRGDPAHVNLRPNLMLQDESLLLLMKSLLALMQSGRRNMTMLYETLTEHLIFNLLSLENRAIEASPHMNSTLWPGALRRVTDYIDDQLEENIKSDTLAATPRDTALYLLS